MIEMKANRGQYTTVRPSWQERLSTLSDNDLSILADHCILQEWNGEGDGVPGSAWELLWHELLETVPGRWGIAVCKANNAHVLQQLTTKICMDELRRRRWNKK